jgi:hypothetical protein
LRLGGAAALVGSAAPATRRAAALRHQRSDTRSALVERRRTSGPAEDRRPRGRPAALRAPSAPACPCRRARRESVPLIVIQRQLGHSNLGITHGLPAGHRQRRDHRDRPCPASADDPSQHIAATLRRMAERCSSRKGAAGADRGASPARVTSRRRPRTWRSTMESRRTVVSGYARPPLEHWSPGFDLAGRNGRLQSARSFAHRDARPKRSPSHSATARLRPPLARGDPQPPFLSGRSQREATRR